MCHSLITSTWDLFSQRKWEDKIIERETRQQALISILKEEIVLGVGNINR